MIRFPAVTTVGSTKWQHVALGTVESGTVQQGAEFTFRPTATLAGSITFQWPLHHRLLGSVTQLTSANIHGVNDGDLKGYSAASCTIEPAM